MPGADRVSLGAWEGGDFVGAIVFSRGATPNIGSPYDLKQTEICELTRVAFRDHEWPISRCLAIALKMLPKKCPRLRMVVSYADPYHDHHGGIYQATNWIFTGRTPAARFLRLVVIWFIQGLSVAGGLSRALMLFVATLIRTPKRLKSRASFVTCTRSMMTCVSASSL
ncbi:hypothetical protein [Salinibacter phage B2_17]